MQFKMGRLGERGKKGQYQCGSEVIVVHIPHSAAFTAWLTWFGHRQWIWLWETSQECPHPAVSSGSQSISGLLSEMLQSPLFPQGNLFPLLVNLFSCFISCTKKGLVMATNSVKFGMVLLVASGLSDQLPDCTEAAAAQIPAEC